MCFSPSTVLAIGVLAVGVLAVGVLAVGVLAVGGGRMLLSLFT